MRGELIPIAAPTILIAMFLLLPRLSAQSSPPIEWKSYFTLHSDEGTAFLVDTVAIAPGGGVPVISIANGGRIILGYSGGSGAGGTLTVTENGRRYLAMQRQNRGPDGGFIYLPDGRTRLMTEEPAPNNTPQRHRSRIVSWLSSDGISWIKEPGIRYQPGADDDSISSVPSVIQVRDSIWRLYYVGDFYRTNGTRTAISSDWGRTWSAESRGNILGQGFVDPQPVYLSDGRTRLYMRMGFGNPNPGQAGIGYCDSDDGLHFSPEDARLVIADTALPRMLKLDPAIIKFPNGDIACYIGAAPMIGSGGQPKVIVGWARKPPSDVRGIPRPSERLTLALSPHPMRGRGMFRIRTTESRTGVLSVTDLLGREVLSFAERRFEAGETCVPLSIDHPGLYFAHIVCANVSVVQALCVVR